MKSPDIPIRPAVGSDYPALCALWEELDEHHRSVRPDLFRTPTGPRRDRAWVLDLIDGPDSAILVAGGSGTELSGLAVVRVDRSPNEPFRVSRCFVQIDNLVVAAAARRRGVGAALIRASAAWAAERDIELVELKMQEFNEGARRFYEAMGFVTARRWMSLSLAPEDPACRPRLGVEESPC